MAKSIERGELAYRPILEDNGLYTHNIYDRETLASHERFGGGVEPVFTFPHKRERKLSKREARDLMATRGSSDGIELDLSNIDRIKHFEAVCVSAVRDKRDGGVTAIYRGENGEAGFYLYSAGYSPSALLGDRKRIAVDGSEIVSFNKPRTGALSV